MAKKKKKKAATRIRFWCEHCNGVGRIEDQIVAYDKFHLAGLIDIFHSGGTARISQIPGIKPAVNSNTARNHMWGLIARTVRDGKVVTHHWTITERGYDFLAGRVAIPKIAFSHGNKCTGHAGEDVFAWDIVDGYSPKTRDAEMAGGQRRRNSTPTAPSPPTVCSP